MSSYAARVHRQRVFLDDLEEIDLWLLLRRGTVSLDARALHLQRPDGSFHVLGIFVRQMGGAQRRHFACPKCGRACVVLRFFKDRYLCGVCLNKKNVFPARLLHPIHAAQQRVRRAYARLEAEQFALLRLLKEEHEKQQERQEGVAQENAAVPGGDSQKAADRQAQEDADTL